MSHYKISEIHDKATQQEIFALRARVWQQSGALAAGVFSSGQWIDKLDEQARHWAIHNRQGNLVGAARLSLHARLAEVTEAEQYERFGVRCDGLIAAPDRVVVCPSAQRQGLATRLLDAQDEAATEANAVCAVRQASPSMCRLITARNWQLLGTAIADKRFPAIDFTVAIRAFDDARIHFSRSAA